MGQKRRRKDRRTIFDDTFRTMIQKMQWMVIPFLNEMFGTSYPEDMPGEQLRNEHLKVGKKIVTDSLFRIGDKLYHIECQSTDDPTMAIRVFEYDVQIALEGAEREGMSYHVHFPYTGILYLRNQKEMPDTVDVYVHFPGGKTAVYQSKARYVQQYRLEEIFQKNLLLFLPFYILRYEKDLVEIAKDTRRKETFLEEFDRIAERLQEKFLPEERMDAYSDLTDLIQDIANYVLDSERELKEGVKHIMGGRVLELYTEKLKRISEKKGRMEEKRDNIRMLMKTTGETAEKAMEMLGIAPSQWGKYKAML